MAVAVVVGRRGAVPRRRLDGPHAGAPGTRRAGLRATFADAHIGRRAARLSRSRHAPTTFVRNAVAIVVVTRIARVGRSRVYAARAGPPDAGFLVGGHDAALSSRLATPGSI